LSCDSDAPPVGSARSESTMVVKVNRRKMNRRKMRPYCTRFQTKFHENSISECWSFSYEDGQAHLARRGCYLNAAKM